MSNHDDLTSDDLQRMEIIRALNRTDDSIRALGVALIAIGTTQIMLLLIIALVTIGMAGGPDGFIRMLLHYLPSN